MFDTERVLSRASEDAPAGHIGPFARSLREQGYTRDSIHGQVLRALWLGQERVGTPTNSSGSDDCHDGESFGENILAAWTTELL